MKKEIIINAAEHEHRITIIEDGKLAELFMESTERERMVGDIFFGKVAKIMPGIRASFIDVGLEMDAFLNFDDMGSMFQEASSIAGDDDEIDTEDDEAPANEEKPRHKRERFVPNLQRGQEILVQVIKEPVGKKGVRVTSDVSIAGRFLVLMPYERVIGVSRKIQNFKEKRRLRRLVRPMLPLGTGAIIRTVAEGKDDDVLRADLQQLLNIWRDIERKMKQQKTPGLIYKDMNTTASIMRDLLSTDVTRIATDSKKLYREIRAYVNMVAPTMVNRVEFYGGKKPIFDVFGVEREVEQTLSRKVWLKSGGYIIIDHTEAMHVIDVNSGRYAPKKEQEFNSLRTNLDAVKEIARQIRLRDMGGLLIIDFIDMDHESSKQKVYEEMRRELRRDRAKFTVLPLTEFGLMQITRQRIRESILHSFSETCPTCSGTGLVQSKSSLLTQIERWLRRFRGHSRELRLTLSVHPSVAAYLTEGSISHMTRLMLKYFIRLKLKEDAAIPLDEFRFFSTRKNRDVTHEHHA